MDEWMDIVWDNIVAAFAFIAAALDQVLAPLDDRIGPAMVILLLVVGLVAVTKLLGKVYNTNRHLELKKDYEHWYALRQEAMACADREKGKALARNIDQAKLNKAYYDYFFEGFLKSIITAILPILFTAAYINGAYAPEKLMQTIGRQHIFTISRSDGDPIAVSAFFWFVICLVLVHLGWMVLAAAGKRLLRKKQSTPTS
jgi:uncharacterized membrane protein (DUF106 family)